MLEFYSIDMVESAFQINYLLTLEMYTFKVYYLSIWVVEFAGLDIWFSEQ